MDGWMHAQTIIRAFNSSWATAPRLEKNNILLTSPELREREQSGSRLMKGGERKISPPAYYNLQQSALKHEILAGGEERGVPSVSEDDLSAAPYIYI